MNCDWARGLATYDCRQVRDLHGGSGLEVGTPFTLLDGSPIVLYLLDQGSHILITDNGDTLSHLSGFGLDVWHGKRQKAMRERAEPHGMTLHASGDLRCITTPDRSPYHFARAVSAVLAVGEWAAQEVCAALPERDLAAEAEPLIVARHPEWPLERRKVVRGQTGIEYRFALRHGPDLIDVISPSAQATGGVMRKVGDVLNGPYLDGLSPLIIVDDRDDARAKAGQEIGIIGSVGRAMAFTSLMH